MVDEISRLRIVCIADAARSSVAFAARRRLDAVARSHLADAIDREVDLDLAVEIARVTVRLDFDPLDYDDATLATLWASRIHTAIAAALAGSLESVALAAPTAVHPAPDRPPVLSGGPPPEPWLVSLARRLIDGDEPAAIELAWAVLAAKDQALVELGADLGSSERRALVRRLGVIAALRERRVRRSRGAKRPVRLSTAGTEAAAGSTMRAGESWPAALVRASRRLAAAERSRAADRGAQRLAGRRTPRVPAWSERPATEPTLRSAVAGMTLLWPWLAAYLDAAMERLPGRNPVHVRRLALAAIVPEEPGAVDDVLVRILAGDDIRTDASVVHVTALELEAAAGRSAEILDAFASALPGFAGSSAPFIRREFLLRPGTIDLTDGGIVVRAATMPLDPILARLPYPIDLFRLPWTPSIRIRLGTA